ncbi:putative uncharacterized protein DDB_G0290521 [Zea mays]|uniref:Uncharacterized protein n=1 Tax=Zea mays TaxID=4577 RepID=B6UBR4_MAIZE|nr:uncharacterized protein LOC100278647 precursor [Zea mays]NP_001151971.2 36.4 kDa proline-rich protein precursor [Zea mays]XP_035821254.1 putative uncharacterized protein DDB_G0290521 [Zea mays]ACG46797.1 hypothetical protein [Zea mays]ONM19832.1 hypothetical protein ZEAMMB73_Zm00001d004945 [Zea mays]ONM19834.1 hypothetical protein ZEAMMB73_Zm00001d004949 [Zea mays]|eukprot:NP_001145324.1 uncharacterized protein LOC100278647 precursor [Zea mays]
MASNKSIALLVLALALMLTVSVHGQLSSPTPAPTPAAAAPTPTPTPSPSPAPAPAPTTTPAPAPSQNRCPPGFPNLISLIEGIKTFLQQGITLVPVPLPVTNQQGNNNSSRICLCYPSTTTVFGTRNIKGPYKCVPAGPPFI